MQLDQILSSNGTYECGIAKILDPLEILEQINTDVRLKNKEIALRKKEDETNREEFEAEVTNCGIKAGFEVAFEDVRPVTEIYFEHEKAAYPKINQAPFAGTYLAIKTDSSTRVISHRAFKYVIQPLLEARGYATDRLCTLETCLADVFANSVIFASGAGEDDDYTRRGKIPPSKEERELNQNRPIQLELLITDKYILTKVTDTGKGITEQDYEESKKYALIPDNWAQLPPDEQHKYLKPHGRGLFMIEKSTGERPLFFKEFAFSTSFIVYKASDVGSCQFPPRDKNRPN